MRRGEILPFTREALEDGAATVPYVLDFWEMAKATIEGRPQASNKETDRPPG